MIAATLSFLAGLGALGLSICFIASVSDRRSPFHVWQCAWCRIYFSKVRIYGRALPDNAECDGHGMCANCFEQETGAFNHAANEVNAL